jgi:hypothetical protein
MESVLFMRALIRFLFRLSLLVTKNLDPRNRNQSARRNLLWNQTETRNQVILSLKGTVARDF